jgi:uncharacterized repeat protein (TIGR02543 family)
MLIVLLALTGCSGDDNDSGDSGSISEGYKLTVSSNDSGMGSVNKEPQKDRYDKNEEVVLTANRKDGYVFDHWEGSGFNGNTNNPLTLTINNDLTIVAVFKEDISDDLYKIKNKIDDTVTNDEMYYEDAKEFYEIYEAVLGNYDNTNVMLKYLELKDLFKNSSNEELANYASSDEFEKNLFFMIIKHAIDEGGYIDKQSVILSDIADSSITLNIIDESSDEYIAKEFSYFTKDNYTELKNIRLKSFYINAKNSFGGYIGNKLVISVSISTTSDYVFWSTFSY